MDDTDPMDEFLKQGRVEDFHKEVQSTEAKPQAMRSAADDIIEKIGGERAPKRAPRACPSCRGVDFVTRRPVSGPATARCRGCGFKMVGPGPRVVDSSPATHDQGAPGPFYRGTQTPNPGDPYSPTSRTKARSYSALKAQDD
jgi:hypothetical protein